MRIGKRGFQARVKGDLHIEYGDETLTSYAGLELVRRFVRGLGLAEKLRSAERRLCLGGDLGLQSVVLLVVAMLLAGARRLAHVKFVGDDPLVLRFAGLARAPSERSLSRALKKLTYRTWPELDALSTHVVQEGVRDLASSRWTLDMDGSVVTTGMKVERATRGFNPHNRKNPSYYPILVTLAQTGHVIAHKNRTGGVHDSHGAAEFLRTTIKTVREQHGHRGIVELRTDSAFFQRPVLEFCNRRDIEYAIKVPMWPWLNIRSVVKKKKQSDWEWVDRGKNVQGVLIDLYIPAWDRTEKIAIYRKKVGHQPFKARQLELFNPDDGHWEYSLVATNKTLQLRALWHFQNGRSVQEKTIAELKSGFCFDTIPTKTYCANTAWQKLNILTHNLVVTLQLHAGAPEKTRTLRRTSLNLLRSVRSLRFEWLNKAARILRPGGKRVLRLAGNDATRQAVADLDAALRQAA